MMPCTLHYVVTVDHSITRGAHFYAASTITQSCMAITHILMCNALITNIDHPKARSLLRRLLVMWIQQYQIKREIPLGKHMSLTSYNTPPHKSPELPSVARMHSPNVLTQFGLLDLIRLGNIIDLSPIMDSRYFTDSIPPTELAEQESARSYYWEFVGDISQHYVALNCQTGNQVNLRTGLFEEQLINFAAGLIYYKTNNPTLDQSFRPKAFSQAVLTHFDEHHKSLKPALEKLIKIKHSKWSFTYPGPPFMVNERRRNNGRVFSSWTELVLGESNFIPLGCQNLDIIEISIRTEARWWVGGC
jgi:hypothetical protein